MINKDDVEFANLLNNVFNKQKFIQVKDDNAVNGFVTVNVDNIFYVKATEDGSADIVSNSGFGIHTDEDYNDLTDQLNKLNDVDVDGFVIE